MAVYRRQARGGPVGEPNRPELVTAPVSPKNQGVIGIIWFGAQCAVGRRRYQGGRHCAVRRPLQGLNHPRNPRYVLSFTALGVQ